MSAETENTPVPEGPQSPAAVKKAADTIAKAKPQAFGKPLPKPTEPPNGNPHKPAPETAAGNPDKGSAVRDALSIFGWDVGE